MFVRIQKHVTDIIPQVIEWRRWFHRYPELGFQEVKTAEKISTLLTAWDYEVKTGLAKTGVTGVIDVGSDFTLGLRFDMDALPIIERTGLPFQSKHKGVMHACGHDGHMAIGLGAAYVLAQCKEQLTINIKFIFQPAEEGLGGAKKLIEEGVLLDPSVNAILGMHIWPELEAGKVGVRHGTIMSAADRFDIVLYGSGGHGGQPHLAVDPIAISSEVVESLQKIVSREVEPWEPVVITVGSIHGGNAFNVIPNKVELTGTVRTVQESVRERVLHRLKAKVEAIAGGNGARSEIRVERSFHPTVNNSALVELFKATVLELWGEEHLVNLEASSMTGEDFSEYQRLIPGLYYFLGTKNEKKGIIHPMHHEKHNLDEDIFGMGIEVLANMAFRVMKEV